MMTVTPTTPDTGMDDLPVSPEPARQSATPSRACAGAVPSPEMGDRQPWCLDPMRGTATEWPAGSLGSVVAVVPKMRYSATVRAHAAP